MENSAFKTYTLAVQTFRRADIETSLDQLGRSKLPAADMKRLLTSSEWKRYQAELEEARQEQLSAPKPEDSLSGAAKDYWEKAQALAHEIIHMPRRSKNPITGQLDHNAEQKQRRRALQDEAAELATWFNREVDPSDQHMFRENHTLFSRYQSFNELEAELPVLKTRKELSPYGGTSVEAFVQRQCLHQALDDLREPKQLTEVTLGIRAKGGKLLRLLGR